MPSSSRTKPPAAAAGFTLLELTIALVVMGIAAGLVLPTLSTMLSREGEKTAARVIQGVLHRARAESLLTGRDWRVDIDWAAGKCRAVQIGQDLALPARRQENAGTDTTAPNQPTARAPAVKDGSRVTVSAGLPDTVRPMLVLTNAGAARQPDRTSIVLRPEGLCQPAFIRLADEAGQSAALTISAVGCRVELLRTDLDAAATRFADSHGLPHIVWPDTGTSSRGG